MKLIWSATSPYARKVMVVAHELGIVDGIETQDGTGTPLSPNAETRSYNPLGKLPCLIPTDGPAIFDSRVIAQYMLTLKPGQTMLAAEGPRRFAALTLESMADGICDAAILIRYEMVLRDAPMQSPAWIEAQMGKINAALDAAEIALDVASRGTVRPWTGSDDLRARVSRLPLCRKGLAERAACARTVVRAGLETRFGRCNCAPRRLIACALVRTDYLGGRTAGE